MRKLLLLFALPFLQACTEAHAQASSAGGNDQNIGGNLTVQGQLCFTPTDCLKDNASNLLSTALSVQGTAFKTNGTYGDNGPGTTGLQPGGNGANNLIMAAATFGTSFQTGGVTKATVDQNGYWNGTLHHTGDWTGTQVSIVISGQNFGVFTPSVVPPGQKLGNVQCILDSATAGTGAAGTLIIKDVTGASTLCTPFSGNFNCALAAGAATTAVSCNAALTAAHQYSYQLSGCTTFPTGLECTTEVLSP